ncbi:hypothetical protein EYV94_17010 [Puteibacter caeruleilacunae]|nr:hypothetical protein EYV94_17010 [Puteibacter caeruleilacunae]
MKSEHNLHQNKQYDLIISGEGLSSIILAFVAFTNDINALWIASDQSFKNRMVRYMNTDFYPTSITQLSLAKDAYREFKTIRDCCPHLILPRKVAAFNTSNFSRIIQLGLGLNLDEKVNAFETIRLEDFAQVDCKSYEEGKVVPEFRIDQERFAIEIKKLCCQEGSCVVMADQEEDVKGLLWYEASEAIDQANCYEMVDLKPAFSNDLRIDDGNNAVHIIPGEDHVLVYATTKKDGNLLSVNKVQECLDGFFKEPVKLKRIEKDSIDNVAINSIQCEHVMKVVDQGIGTVLKHVEQARKMMKKVLGLKELKMVEKFPCAAYEFTGDYRSLSEVCDEKFDIAKQTGIAYSDFAKLFYLYGSQVDWMTDQAYEMMSQTRDAEVIWKKVENDFLDQYEK